MSISRQHPLNRMRLCHASLGVVTGPWSRKFLGKMRVKELRKLLKEMFADKCTGCKHKDHFIARVQQLHSETKDEL